MLHSFRAAYAIKYGGIARFARENSAKKFRAVEDETIIFDLATEYSQEKYAQTRLSDRFLSQISLRVDGGERAELS